LPDVLDYIETTKMSNMLPHESSWTTREDERRLFKYDRARHFGDRDVRKK
jgi:hypothetical protein